MDSNVIIAILSTAAVFGIVCLVLHRRYRRTIGKVTFLFNAIDNLDSVSYTHLTLPTKISV